MAGIGNSPNDVTLIPSEQGNAIRYCGYVCAHFLRVAIVVFKLNPLAFLSTGAQFPYKINEVFVSPIGAQQILLLLVVVNKLDVRQPLLAL